MVGEDVVVEIWCQGRVSHLILKVGLNDWMTIYEKRREE